MNIFYLDKDPIIAATYHNDKHVVKMILESAQLLSTAHRVLDGKRYIEIKNNRKISRWRLSDNEDILYKATHINHPSNVWARTTSENYMWLYQLFNALCAEYTHRYGKVHKTSKLLTVLSELPKHIPINKMTEVPQAMPDKYRMNDSIDAYRAYYNEEKVKFSKYTKRECPEWLEI